MPGSSGSRSFNDTNIDGTTGETIQLAAPVLTIRGSGAVLVGVSAYCIVTGSPPATGSAIFFSISAFDISTALNVPVATVSDSDGNLTAYFSTTMVDAPGFSVGDTVTYSVQMQPRGSFAISVPQANLASVFALEIP